MDKIIISEDRYGRKRNHFENDDFIDRLNNRYTVMVLVMCIFIITGKTYVGDPINCWTPAQFTGPHTAYTKSICWLKGSYYLPTEEITIPDRSKPRLYHVSYYQWTPFILLGMGLLFLLPQFLWGAFTRQGSLNIRRLVHTLKEHKKPEESLNSTANIMKQHIDTQNDLRGTVCCGFRCPNIYVGFTVMYFIVKSLYVINALGQFFLLNAFLSFNFSGYGREALNKLFSGDDWFESPRFPRVTMCDFMIRNLGSNQHWYAIQCNLPINMYNEKIFFGIWVWLIVLAVINSISIIFWSISLTRKRRRATIKKYLKTGYTITSSSSSPPEKASLLSSSPTTSRIETVPRHINYDEFTDYMHIDGFLLFRLIAENTDEYIASQIIRRLHENYSPLSQEPMSSV